MMYVPSNSYPSLIFLRTTAIMYKGKKTMVSNFSTGKFLLGLFCVVQEYVSKTFEGFVYS